MSQGVTRLIEATVKFRKLAFVGLSKKYQGKVRGNPEDHETIRAFVGTYSPAIYAYYSSYASAAIQEEKRSHTIFKSARIALREETWLFGTWHHKFSDLLSLAPFLLRNLYRGPNFRDVCVRIWTRPHRKSIK